MKRKGKKSRLKQQAILGGVLSVVLLSSVLVLASSSAGWTIFETAGKMLLPAFVVSTGVVWLGLLWERRIEKRRRR